MNGFERKSYIKWTIDSIIDILRKNPNIAPLILMEEYRDKLLKFSTLNQNTKYIFDEAVDIMNEIIRYILS